MKFFIPAVSDADSAERHYEIAIKVNTPEYGPFTNKRIYRVIFTEKGRRIADEVGKVAINGEIIIAILEGVNGLCYTVTKSRGLWNAGPLISNPETIEYFD